MILVIDQSPAVQTVRLEDELLRTFSELSVSQGDDGRVVVENLATAARHLFDRPLLLAEMAQRGLAERVASNDVDLWPVPRQILGSIEVRYVEGKRIAPLPYPIDDE